MKSSLILISSSFLGVNGFINFDKIFGSLPSEAFNSTRSINSPILSSIKICSSAGSHASNFVATVTPDQPKAGDEVSTTFDYVSIFILLSGVCLPFIPLTNFTFFSTAICAGS